MATQRTSSVKVQRDFRGFTTVLASAVLEWLLIFLLFVDAIFSYLVTKFARYYKLQIPCLLCSRLDHVLGDEKPGFYRNLICGEHKLEISSLVLCHIHGKLADVHGMCEGCLFSFATENKSNSETYRLLVGKLGRTDLECCVDQDPRLEDPKLGSLSSRHCSCCNEPWQSRLYAQRLLQTNSIGSKIAELDVPSPELMGDSRLHRHDGLKKRRDKPSVSVTSSHIGNSGFDSLSHIGYTELKITSDSESEVPFSDDDDRNSLVHEKDVLKEDFTAQFVPLGPCITSPDILPKTLFDDLAQEKLIPQDSMPVTSLLVPRLQPAVSEPHDVASAVATGHGLEELNWHHVEQKANPSALCEFISFDDIPISSNVAEAPVEVPENLDLEGTGDIEHKSIIDGEVGKPESQAMTSGAGFKTDLVSNEAGLLMPSSMDLSDAYKMVISNKGRQLSGMLAEQLTGKDSARVSEDLKLLLSQISAARGIEVSLNDMSPKVYGHGDELKITDASSSTGMQILQKRISLERNESGFESLDGSIVSEIEGESVVDRLKRQVESDRKSMSALYKELEEERSASAVAANQAMAMITRLQEEKAALHMEALQYLRMMEEQAEYDVEALQKANDLLSEREKDIQDLEAELEFYRNKFPNELLVENKPEIVDDLKGEDMRKEHSELVENQPDLVNDLKGKDMRVERSDASCIEINTNVPCNMLLTKKSEGSDKPEVTSMMCGDKNVSIVKNSLLEFEDERLYISQCLKKLENKLHLFSNNGVYTDISNGGYSGNEADGVNDLEELHRNKETQKNNQMEEGLSMQKDPSISIDCAPTQEECIPSVGNPQFVSKENNHFDCNGQDSSMVGRETDLFSLESEVLDLNDRLEALEADRNFLEHTINSLRNGDEGLQFVQEIAHHLRELRRIGIRRDPAVA
ncbi:hypothetical protein HHK36_026857 [Tetracentron sinense]|uniref:GTD-binding domain-containing protein n=1 Tax=Tetracentron sinense TaxID=13715 RepID=A0A834YM43_TETSI|nr:hypothetical protein HHK36_026857 [Tetracentron sinense]